MALVGVHCTLRRWTPRPQLAEHSPQLDVTVHCVGCGASHSPHSPVCHSASLLHAPQAPASHAAEALHADQPPTAHAAVAAHGLQSPVCHSSDVYPWQNSPQP